MQTLNQTVENGPLPLAAIPLVMPVADRPEVSIGCEISDGLERNLKRLWRFALVRCGDRAQADDLVQATCVRALERSSQFEPGSRIDSWLFKILESIWRNTIRAQQVRLGNGTVDVADAQLESGDADEETRIRLADAVRQIGALPRGQRVVLMLVCIEGFSYAEAASILRLPTGTIMSRLASARSKLRETVAPDRMGIAA
jgi:RNA polymerase sigma-70 factor (ECF subfamily)